MKAALILNEMPKRCTDCKFINLDNMIPCCIVEADRMIFSYNRPDWCPLQELSTEKFSFDVTTGNYIYKEQGD